MAMIWDEMSRGLKSFLSSCLLLRCCCRRDRGGAVVLLLFIKELEELGAPLLSVPSPILKLEEGVSVELMRRPDMMNQLLWN